MSENIQAAYVPPVVERLHGMIRTNLRPVAVAGALLVAAACGGSGEQAASGPEGSTVGSTPGTEVVDTTVTPEVCADSWEMPGVDHGEQNKWFGEGLQAIYDAVDDETARAASDAWVNGTADHPGIKHDDKLFVAGYNAVFGLKDVEAQLTVEGIRGDDGCATDKAVMARVELEANLATSKITPVDAVPEDWVNTGTDAEGNVTVAAEGGVFGDTKAIRIETADGNVVYVMARCGQPVIPGDHPIVPGTPKGPTDNPHNPNPKVDDGRLPGDPNVPADQDPGTPDNPGQGPAGQTPGPDGYLPTETRPTAPRNPDSTVAPTTPPNTTPATTNPRPTSTVPVSITLPTPTTAPDPVMPVQP